MSLTFCPLASGSDGNSVYIGAEDAHILIDAGLTGRAAEDAFRTVQLAPALLDAIFVTHEHSDHILGVGVLSRRYGVPVYATEKTWAYINRKRLLGKLPPDRQRPIPPEGVRLKNFTVRPFPVPHDAIDPVGYTVAVGTYKVALATDLGHVTDIVRENLMDADILYIESNHDPDMLRNGPYPQDLKARVMGSKGHLSNPNAGHLILDVMGRRAPGVDAAGGAAAAPARLKHIYLGHMSEENNRPLIALDTVANILTAGQVKVGVDVRLYLAHRGMVSEPLRLEGYSESS